MPETIEYLGSFPIPDDRMGPRDAMLSAFFVGYAITNERVKARDDLDEALWVPVERLREQKWYENHVPMLEALCAKLGA